MMKGWLLTIGSVVLTGFVIGNAYYQKQQFFPSVVYITKSNPSLAVLYLQAFVFVILLGQLVRKAFFGQLRPAETEHLIERSWYAVTETCLAFTVFRDNFSPLFVAQFTMLLFSKCFHWLAEDRVDYMERSPVITIVFHLRAIGIFLMLGTVDSLFIHQAYHSVLDKGASTQLVFGFEYAILLTIVVAVLTKYVLHTMDLQSENPWENKAVYILYSELVMGFIKSVLYIAFMVIMIRVHTFPLFAIRPMYLTLRSFKKSVSDVIMSRRAILNMNTLYPDATAEELEGDNVCIICREEMAANCKKLPCNHIFHASCLRSWFQRQQSCPTCRMDVLLAQPRRPQQPAQPAAAAHPAAIPAQHGAQPIPPPPFPMFPMGFPPMPHLAGMPAPPPAPPPTPAAPHTTGVPPPSTASGPGPSTSQATSPPFMPPFSMFPPPFLGFPFPPAVPPPDLSILSPEQLEAMEGKERENVEARIAVLRNIHSLLDTAILQLNQYSQIVAAHNAPFSAWSVQATTSTNNHQAADAVPTSSAAEDSSSVDVAGPSWDAADAATITNTAEDADTIVSSSVDVAGPSWAATSDDVMTETSSPAAESETTELITSADSHHDNIRQRRLQRFSSEPDDNERKSK